MTLGRAMVRAYIGSMTHRITVAALLALTFATPLPAQEAGRSLMERGAELFLEGLQKEMAPALDDLRGLVDEFGPAMQGFVTEMGPAFGEILAQVKDWSRYHPPEILPNGDIIIRRKADPKDEDRQQDTLPPSGATDI